MANSYFTFKQFTVRHDRCAMKVGTDGVLLGAWTDVSASRRILDVGTGTGLIALMLAQRCEAFITGIDIDTEAVGQAAENIAASPWKDRVGVMQQDVCSYTPTELYDTIVSNPPFFIQSLKCPDCRRNTARHTDTLDAERLFAAAARLLRPDGCFSLILPAEQKEEVVGIAARSGFGLLRHTAVVTRPGLPPKRSLLEFRKTEGECRENELVIELSRHVYSEDYIALTRAFYLKM